MTAYAKVTERDGILLHCPAGIGYKIISRPTVRVDLPGYESPVTGKWIEGKRARREDLARTHCRPYEEGEKEQMLSRKAHGEERFEQAIDETVEAELARMPTRKKELLVQEIAAGAGIEVTRR